MDLIEVLNRKEAKERFESLVKLLEENRRKEFRSYLLNNNIGGIVYVLKQVLNKTLYHALNLVNMYNFIVLYRKNKFIIPNIKDVKELMKEFNEIYLKYFIALSYYSSQLLEEINKRRVLYTIIIIEGNENKEKIKKMFTKFIQNIKYGAL